MDWQMLYTSTIYPIIAGIFIGWLILTIADIKKEVIAIRKLMEKRERN